MSEENSKLITYEQELRREFAILFIKQVEVNYLSKAHEATEFVLRGIQNTAVPPIEPVTSDPSIQAAFNEKWNVPSPSQDGSVEFITPAVNEDAVLDPIGRVRGYFIYDGDSGVKFVFDPNGPFLVNREYLPAPPTEEKE